MEGNDKNGVLDGLRGFAAIYVVIHHFLGFTSIGDLVPSVIRLPFRFGQEMVMLFFLMSGFVIFKSFQRNPGISFKAYAMKRFKRIYPVFMLALLLSIVVNFLNGGSLTVRDGKELVGNLLMLQDTGSKPGVFVFPFLENHSLWSLSYEWTFYMLFFLVSKGFAAYPNLNYKQKMLCVGVFSWCSLILYLLKPNHVLLTFSYFGIWWTGVFMAERHYKESQKTLSSLAAMFLTFGGLIILMLINIMTNITNSALVKDFNLFPLLQLRHFFFVALVAGISPLLIGRFKELLVKIFTLFKTITPISYGLYCVHFPVIWLDLHFLHNVWLETIIKFLLVLVFGLSVEKIGARSTKLISGFFNRYKSIPILANH